MQIAWVTDIHLNFVDLVTWERWIDTLNRLAVDALVITGDIGESEDVNWHLDRIQSCVGKPIYFVLGNHDFYRGSIAGVREKVRKFTRDRPRLHYATHSPPISLENGWQLVGHDGWGDAQKGDYWGSQVRMADFELIAELRGLSLQERRELLGHLGEESARQLRGSLVAALETGANTLVLTHVPPFVEACWFEGRSSHPDWLPFFTCDAIGQMLLEMADQFPNNQILVLCGHTHHSGKVKMRPNLSIWTGPAEYGIPSIVEVLDLNLIANQLR